MTVTDRIKINPKVMLGKPVIRGTRVPVELILRKLSEGATEDDLLDAYPPSLASRYSSGHRLRRRYVSSRGNFDRDAAKNPDPPMVDALCRRRDAIFRPYALFVPQITML
jgi:Protein of unknown function (DUF433)